MRSLKQIEASRINGRLSKGPITPEGKFHSARNNLRHGLLAQTVVLEKESEERFLELLDDFMQTHQPQSATEAALVETMVVARWRLLRIWGLQKLALDHDIAVQDPGIGPASVRAMHAVRGSPDTPPRPDVLLRYEVTYDRQFKSALRHLELQSRHRKTAADPYFPTHPSGHNWEDDHEADQAMQEPDSPSQNRDRKGAGRSLDSPASRKTPCAIRPQEVVESKTSPKSDPVPKSAKTHRGADSQVRRRLPRPPASAESKSRTEHEDQVSAPPPLTAHTRSANDQQ